VSQLARVLYEACPLCGHEEVDVVGTTSCRAHALYRAELPEAMRWLSCTRCHHVFVDGWFDDAALAVLFQGANTNQLPGLADLDRWRQISARIVERVQTARGRVGGRWLDVGFGNGSLVTTAVEYGFEALGLDVRQDAVTRLRAEGFSAECTTLEHFTSAVPFDVISFCDVLEHMPFPRVALERAHRLLSEHGVVLVSAPNRDCYHWQAMDRAGKNPYWSELEHLHNFGRARLESLLREVGFTPAAYSVSERYLAGMEVVARRGA
jgi:SAM-dependent methyltransferase